MGVHWTVWMQCRYNIKQSKFFSIQPVIIHRIKKSSIIAYKWAGIRSRSSKTSMQNLRSFPLSACHDWFILPLVYVISSNLYQSQIWASIQAMQCAILIVNFTLKLAKSVGTTAVVINIHVCMLCWFSLNKEMLSMVLFFHLCSTRYLFCFYTM